MRILLLGDYPSDPRLGSTKVLLKLQEEFQSLGHTCDVLLSDEMRLPTHRVARWTFAPLAAAAAVRRFVRRYGPYDVIDAASAEGLWVAATRRLGAFPGTVIVARSNGIEHLNYARMLADADAGLMKKPWTRRWFYPVARLSQVGAALRAADRAIVLNEADRAFVLRRGWKREDEIEVVPHGVSARFIASAPPSGATRGNGILFCASWDFMKGVTYLADAFSRLVDHGALLQPDGVPATLTILGGGVPAERIRAAFSRAAQPHLTVIERVDEEQVIAAYRSHDVFAFSSTYEGFGMVLIEAMSQRLPVVTTSVGYATTVVRDEQTGLVVPARDADALAAALGRLLRDRALRTRLADAAFERVRAMSWSETALATLAVYRRAAAARPAFAHA